MAQLRKLFPEGQEGVLLANASLIFFAVNEVQDAKYVASRLGEATIVVESGGSSHSTSHQSGQQQGGYSYSTSTNHNWQQMGRSLLKPEEVIGLHPRVALTFTPGVPPIWTWLTRYYEKSFGESTGSSPAKMIFDSACLFLCSAMLAALWTAGLFQHSFR
jgi:type IV secretion system protein VirD4